MVYVDVKFFNKIWILVRCTTILVLLFAGAVRAFAFSHPVEIEIHTNADEFRGSVENDRGNKEAYDRVNAEEETRGI